MRRVVVIGASIAGGMAASYLKVRSPDLDVVVLDRDRREAPIVGESLTELSTRTLHEIGLASHLERHQLPKYGLTFHFRESAGAAHGRRYATHEAPRLPPMPSNQINRFTFDRRLRRRARELGVRILEGTARNARFGPDGEHRIRYVDGDGGQAELEASWVLDASGRNRFLARKLGLRRESRLQRSVFWFRLQGFERSALDELPTVKPPQHCFDSYYATHHFFGRHNWVWAIPLHPGPDGEELMSVGIVYRPDLFAGEISSVQDFLDQVDQEHPALARLVRSGRVLDTNAYRNYLYECSRCYGGEGWFLVGDAGDAVDPLYSTGLALTALQIRQVAAVIERALSGRPVAGLCRDLEAAYKAVRDALQNEISSLYEVMDDPYQSHLRMHLSSAVYFFFLLPFWLTGYATSGPEARLTARLLEREQAPFESLRTLLAKASARLGPQPAEAIRNRYQATVNWDLSGPCERELPRYLARLCRLCAGVRFEALRASGWHRWWHHVPLAVADLAKAAVLAGPLRRVRLGRLASLAGPSREPSPSAHPSPRLQPARAIGARGARGASGAAGTAGTAGAE